MKLFFSFKRKKMIFWLVLIFVLSIVVYIPVRRNLLQSAPYRMSEKFIKSNSSVISTLGENLSCDLKTFSGYSLKYNNDGGKADFDVYVNGSKGKGKVKISLIKNNDNWKIVHSKLYTNGAKHALNLLETANRKVHE